MDYSTYRISLDIYSSQSQVSLPMKLGDTSRKIYITLCEGGLPYELADDCFAVFSASKSDGNVIENNCIIEGNTIRYDVTAQTTSAVGKVDCELKLYGGDSQLIVSPRFTIIVDTRAVDDGSIESTNEYSALTTLYTETNALIDELEGYAESAETSAESASASATEAAASAKNALQYAGEAESSAYGASQFAQSASASAESAESSKTEAAQSANDASGYVSAASQFAQSAEGYAKNAEQYATYASNSAQSAATSAEALTSHNESEEAHSALFAEVKSEVESAQITADMADINAATAQSKANTAYAKANLPFGITGSMLSAATEIAFNYYLMSDSGVPEQHYLKLDLTDFGFTEDMLSETEMSLAVYFDLVDGEWVATIEPSDTAVKVFTWNLNKNGLIDLVPADMGYTMFSRSNHTHAVATTSANGFMSASDKVKFKAMQSKVNNIDDDQKALLARLIDCGAVKQPVYIEHSAILTMTDVPYIEYTSSDFANPVTNIIGGNAVSSFVSSVSMVNNNLSEISVAIGTYETSEYPQFVHIDVNNGYMKSNTFINPINMERAETGTYTPSRDSFEITGDDMAITYDMCRAVVFDSSELEDPTRFKIVSEKLKSVSDEEYGDYVFQGTAPEYFIFEDDVVIQTVSSPDGSVIEFYNSETNELIYEWNTTETGDFYMSEKFEYCPHIKIIQKNT